MACVGRFAVATRFIAATAVSQDTAQQSNDPPADESPASRENIILEQRGEADDQQPRAPATQSGPGAIVTHRPFVSIQVNVNDRGESTIGKAAFIAEPYDVRDDAALTSLLKAWGACPCLYAPAIARPDPPFLGSR